MGHHGSDGYCVALLGWGFFFFFFARAEGRSWRCILFLPGSKVCFSVCQKKVPCLQVNLETLPKKEGRNRCIMALGWQAFYWVHRQKERVSRFMSVGISYQSQTSVLVDVAVEQ